MTKPFDIPKQLFVDAFKHVKANAGAAGVDRQSLEEFEQNLKDNTYKLWNRMSSGSYFPPPVMAVPIPKKSALDAIGITRERCWRFDWVLEYDIKGLFDNIPHDLLMKAVRKHTECKWSILYIERWLKAPLQTSEGELVSRDRTRGCISPTPYHHLVRCRRDPFRNKGISPTSRWSKS